MMIGRAGTSRLTLARWDASSGGQGRTRFVIVADLIRATRLRVFGKLMTLTRRIRTKGIRATLRKAFRDHVYAHERHVFLRRDLSIPHREYARNRDWIFRLMENDRGIEKFRANFETAIAGITTLFDQGALATVCFIDNEIVGYMWYAKSDYFESDYAYQIHLKDDEVYQFAGILLPKYRGRPIVLDCMRFSHEYLCGVGYRWSLCIVDIELPANLALHLKLGFEEMGKILYVWKLFFLRWSKVETYEGERFADVQKRRGAIKLKRGRLAAMSERMARMMTRVGIDPTLATHGDPETRARLRESRRLCEECPTIELCERWLAGDAQGSNEFCPNAETFHNLRYGGEWSRYRLLTDRGTK